VAVVESSTTGTAGDAVGTPWKRAYGRGDRRSRPYRSGNHDGRSQSRGSDVFRKGNHVWRAARQIHNLYGRLASGVNDECPTITNFKRKDSLLELNHHELCLEGSRTGALQVIYPSIFLSEVDLMGLENGAFT
jgi:hypothetical protein